MACLSSSSSIRLNNFVPSVLIVSGRSNGKRWYIFPPAKWQGWQCACRIGWIWVAKSTFEDVDADGNGIPTWRELAADGASVRCVRSQAQKAKASARIKMLFSTDTNLPKTVFSAKASFGGDSALFFDQLSRDLFSLDDRTKRTEKRDDSHSLRSCGRGKTARPKHEIARHSANPVAGS
jgi:hypothetical protein